MQNHLKPNTEDVEKYNKEKRRFLMAIRIRWYLFSSLFAFLITTLAYFSLTQSAGAAISSLSPYFLVVAIIGLHNYLFNYIFIKYSMFKGFTQAQLVIDIALISILLYMAGGILSWLWGLYFFLIIETALLFEGSDETWAIAVLAVFSFILILTIQVFAGITQTKFPFVILAPADFSAFAIVITIWFLILAVFFTFVGNYLGSSIHQREQEMGKRIVTDGLTGLFNQTHFWMTLKSEIRRSNRYDRKFSLLLIDIDDFKIYNDHFGHRMGDLLLKKMSDHLRNNIRKEDVDLVFRYGGEEFAIIVPEIKVEGKKYIGAVALAERLRKRLEELLKVTVSIGVSSYPIHGNSAEELFNNADKAMFEAKRKGKNKVVIAKISWVRKKAA